MDLRLFPALPSSGAGYWRKKKAPQISPQRPSSLKLQPAHPRRQFVLPSEDFATTSSYFDGALPAFTFSPVNGPICSAWKWRVKASARARGAAGVAGALRVPYFPYPLPYRPQIALRPRA